MRLSPLRRRLPEKIAADPAGRLVFFGFTDIGVLNNVVELWRYPSAQASIRCMAARRLVRACTGTLRESCSSRCTDG